MSKKNDLRRPVPEWLAKIDPNRLGEAEPPIDDILRQSLYYPACGIDGSAISRLGGLCHSFIYVDCAETKGNLEKALREGGFRGYSLIGRRSIDRSELNPNHNWRPRIPATWQGTHCYSEKRFILDRGELAGILSRWCDESLNPFFCDWMIFERDEGFTDNHGPERFSLMFLCAEGIAAYQALFVDRGIAPLALAIIRPGSWMGNNFDDYEQPNSLFAHVVLGANPKPDYLFCGGYFEPEPFWPERYPHDMEGLGFRMLWRRRDLP